MSPVEVRSRRSLRRVTMTSPTCTHPSAVSTERVGSRSPRSMRARWMVVLIAWTCSLVVVVIAMLPEGALQPGGGDGVEVLVEPAGTDSIVVLVVAERCGVAVSQLEGRGGFPPVGEPVDRVEFDHPAGGAEFGEHATAGDGLELLGVTDQGEAPVGVGRPVRSGGGGRRWRACRLRRRSPWWSRAGPRSRRG